nr:amidase [Actinomycetota bacterium]
MDDVLWLDACAQRQLVDEGELSASELIAATIERIEEIDRHINAVIHRSFERAIDAAQHPNGGPFAGIPILIKDAICHTAGDPMHEGMRFLKRRNWTEDFDSYLAQRFRRAGFVFVGKTNLPELALAPTTEPVAYGATRNPWDLDRSTGGSSGGAAAAVASGMVAVAHANDWAGSIRIPASACGVVGLKPSRAEIAGGRGAEHAITRSVRDTAAVLDAIAGRERGDPYTAPPVDGSFTSHLHSGRVFRVGIFAADRVDGTPIQEACKIAVREAGHALESHGHLVEESWPRQIETGMAGH